jgi:asparagine synthase (glutamine-hydrolysing)
MANSLEIRNPFLDYTVVDFAFSLPENFKIDKQHQKRIVKDAFRKELPQEIYYRSKKGFEVPLLKWFQTELKSKINDLWLEENFIKEQGIFNFNEIALLKHQLFSGTGNEIQARIWGLIVFQNWWLKHHQN